MTTKVFPTPAALREMREAAAARAYPDPWEVDGDAVIVVDDPDAPRGFPTFSCVAECPTPAVASFVAHTRTDVPALVARVRDLAAKLDASAQAFDALVADVWRATGETHEPPADVAALLARVEGQREALDGYRLAAVDVVERIDGERQEPDFDMPAEFGAYVCDEVDHLRAAVAAEAHAREAAVAARARVERDVCEAAGEARDPRHDAADVVRRAVAAARREGAEAMREQCAQAAARVASAWARCECRCACGSSLAGLAAAEACAAEIRALPIVEAP